MLTQSWKLSIAIKTINLIPTKPKTLVSKITKEHRIGFGNSHSHVMLISKISPFIKLIWEQHHQLTFVTIVQYVIQNCLSFAANKQGIEFLTIWSCHRLRYHIKSFNSTVWITILQYKPPETSQTANICMLMVFFLFI